jgi:D-xylose 1-dehydrogenase (NADP+, D-xylono-1,5-lactone-forming)
MTNQMLSWGLLGTARINRALIPAIRAASRSQLRAVASRSHEKATAYAAEWDIPVPHDSYEALLADPAIDVVYIPLPNHLHVDWTLAVIAAGKHVLCEKPIALVPEDVDRVAEAARAAGVVVAEAFMYRHHPATRHVADMVASGAIGALRVVRGAFTFVLNRPNDVRLTPEWGGGSLWDVGCYPVSYARLLAGGEPISVTGQAVLGPTGIDMGFGGSLLFADGMIAVFDCSFGAAFRTLIEVGGTEGTLIVPAPFKPGEVEQLMLHRGDQIERIEVAGEPLYLGEVQDLERAVLDGARQAMSLADSRGNVATLAALHHAAQTGQSVRV